MAGSAAEILANRLSSRKWRAKHPERMKASNRRNRARHPETQRAAVRRWEAANPEKRAAHIKIASAVRSGRLPKLPKGIERHHTNYSTPLKTVLKEKGKHAKSTRKGR